MVGSRRFRLSLGCLAALILLVSAPGAVGAQDQPANPDALPAAGTAGTDLSVSPAVIDDSLDPGITYDVTIRLANMTNDPVAVRGGTRELIPDQEISDARRQAFDASSWITVKDPEFILLGRAQRSITATVSVPPNAEPGGHYATINFDSIAPQQRPDNVTSVSTRVGVLVLLTVSGDIRQEVDIVGPVRVQSVQAEAGPTGFAVTLRNDGNVHVVPQGNFVVTDAFGRKVEEVPITPGVVLPGAQRNYQVDWEHGLYVGAYRVAADLVVGQQPQQLRSEETRFYLLPLVVLVPAGLLLLLLTAGLLRRWRKHRRREAIASNTQSSNVDTSSDESAGKESAGNESGGNESGGEGSSGDGSGGGGGD